ncbi:hypothetical protein GCM10009118_16000 [Wandonia haliotis]|uniref:LAGLIDADG homing endonuclease n=1 Tax=Wandonia haliotis TaxID=574963 RepID=A0ABP3Y0Q7_9FLAO
MIIKNHKKLEELCISSELSKLLFSFEFHTIEFKCLYFQKSSTFLISHSNQDCAYMFALDDNGKFNGKLPSEFYYSIRGTLLDQTGSHNITQLWESLDYSISLLRQKDVEIAGTNDIIEHLGNTKTDDKSYDELGNLPYFKTWRRNSERTHVSGDNLRKTERLFGSKVREKCYQENISSVWSNVPTEKSLEFLK